MGNREYKSDVFCMLLEDRKNALALKTAIDECIENNILRDFLIERRSEVEKIMRLDYTFDRQIELEKRDSFEEGLSLGREEGLSLGQAKQLITLIAAKIRKGKSISEIADDLETDISTIKSMYDIIIKYSPDYSVDDILEAVLSSENINIWYSYF